MKSVLMIAFHFPPISGSSGLQRTLKFATYIREHGWRPIVLTAHPRAYPATTGDQLAEIPEDVIVERAFALDTSRHLSIKGRYPDFLALPDNYVSWWLGGTLAGKRLIKNHRPDLIWSTYPIATAHMIGKSLQAWSGLPWIADFRDSMTEDNYPTDPTKRRIYQKIEKATVYQAAHSVFTTPSALNMYKERYPDIAPQAWRVIHNGFDEENFRTAEKLATGDGTGQRKRLLVHSGILYPAERDPRPFFTALARLKQESRISADDLEVRLRATGHDGIYLPIIEGLGLQDIVRLAPSVPYAEALGEMLSADGLLLFQASSCNHQIPAKLYEYLRAGRPVFALTDRAGDTAGVLEDNGLTNLSPLDDSERLYADFGEFLTRLSSGDAPVPDPEQAQAYSRRAGSARLAQLFDETLERITPRG